MYNFGRREVPGITRAQTRFCVQGDIQINRWNTHCDNFMARFHTDKFQTNKKIRKSLMLCSGVCL